jgi:subtilisin family serine protease
VLLVDSAVDRFRQVAPRAGAGSWLEWPSRPEDEMNVVRRILAGSACLLFVACATTVADDDPPDPGEPGRAPARAAPDASRAGRSPAAAAASPSDVTSHTVTLITGDRVTMRGAYGPVTFIEAGPGRRGVRFRTITERDRLLVVPADVQPLIAAGVVDRRLFDMTELVQLGYHDAGRADLPLLVTRSRGVSALARSTLTSAGARVKRALPSIGGEALSVPKGRAAAVWASLSGAGSGASLRGVAAGPGVKVWLDGRREILLDHSAAQIGAPDAWDAGYTGAGVTIAVLDSGLDVGHPDFAGRLAGLRNFMDDGTDPEEVPDHFGHGTHVASIAAGSGAAGGGVYRGIAPDATLLIGKVCEEFGCPESAIIAGMEWAASSGARVVNMSLGGPDSPGVDPMEEAIDTLTAQYGTLFVAAAGNAGRCGGPDFQQVVSPGAADAALSVGAVDPDDALAEFSCRGPRLGDGAVKPEITAPGVAIAAARAVGTPIGERDPVDEFYARVSGTSMATPHVTGAAAVLAQQHPDWRAPELKAALMGSARPGEGIAIYEQGSGRVDVGEAITLAVLPSPANLIAGMVPWPHDDDEPITRTLTYRNLGTDEVQLSLSASGAGPDGQPAPAGMFTVGPAAIAIPPGGEASVTVTIDTRGMAPTAATPGWWSRAARAATSARRSAWTRRSSGTRSSSASSTAWGSRPWAVPPSSTSRPGRRCSRTRTAASPPSACLPGSSRSIP